jgi:ADP-ribosyl-[dinitrogen reductase] hydrolase
VARGRNQAAGPKSPSSVDRVADCGPDKNGAQVNELDRAIGALLGLAVGDAVGTTLEFRSPGTFAPIDDMVGGGPFQLEPGEWTDDTSMALCLAESLLDTRAMDLEDQLRRYLLWYEGGYLSSNGACFDIGNTIRGGLERFRRTGQAIDPEPDEHAAANGSLMRLAPVPIVWHSDPAEAAAQSAESSLTTHAARRPVDACRLMGAIVSALINGTSFEAVSAPTFWEWGDLHREVADIAAGAWKHKEPPAIKGTGYCIAALEAALWAVGRADDFRSAVLRAANLGGDADTTAAIAGQIAGARWGASAIPDAWLNRVVARDRITSLARGLYIAGEGTTDLGPWPYDKFVHAWWVNQGRLLAGEYPGNKEPTRSRQKIDILVDAGIRTFVDLTTPADRLEPYEPLLRAVALARGLDLRHVSFPIPDNDVVQDHEYDRIADAIAEAKAHGGVYVHCWGGVGRTGTVIGCALVDEGLSYEKTIGRLGTLRSATRKADRQAPEVQVQQEVIKRRATAKRAKLGDADFADGIRASLKWLSQSLTYAGLLDGAPTAEMNRDLISSLRERYRRVGRGHDPLVIEPVQTPIGRSGNDPFGERSLLPRVLCVAEYSSPTPVPDDEWATESNLTLVWWQNDWALPIDELCLKRLPATRGETWPTVGRTESARRNTCSIAASPPHDRAPYHQRDTPVKRGGQGGVVHR